MGPRQPTDLGWWILRAMADRDLSQTELARRVGVAQGTISRWIYEPRRADIKALRRLADTLGTPYGEVLTLAGYDDTAPTPVPDSTDGEDELLTALKLLLDRSSPVPPDKLATLRAVLQGVITPYWEQYMTTRRRRTG